MFLQQFSFFAKGYAFMTSSNANNRNITGLKHEPKLTWRMVNDIREKYVYKSSKYGCAALAKEFNVNRSTIHKVVTGKTWKLKLDDGNVPLPSLYRSESKKDMNKMIFLLQKAYRDRELFSKDFID